MNKKFSLTCPGLEFTLSILRQMQCQSKEAFGPDVSLLRKISKLSGIEGNKTFRKCLGWSISHSWSFQLFFDRFLKLEAAAPYVMDLQQKTAYLKTLLSN